MDDGGERDSQSGRDDHEAMNELDLHLTRRQLFGLTARGIGAAALGALLRDDLFAHGAAPRPGVPHFAPKAKRVIFLHQSGGPSQLETFDYKPALAKFQGDADPRLRAPGPARRADDGAVGAAGGEIAVRVQPARPVGDVGQRAAAPHGEDRRRHHRHQDDEHRRDQPRSRDHVHPDRIPAAGPAQHGGVAQLWPGQREPEPPGLRRPAVAGERDQRRPAAVLAAVGQRVPAVGVSGRAVPRRQRAGALPRGSPRRQQAHAASDARRRQEAECDEAGRVRRSGNRSADRAVRDGLPDADVGAGADGSVEGAGFGLRDVRSGIAQARHVRRELPDGAAAGGTRTCGSSSSIIAAGISTTTCRATWRCSAKAPTRRARRS